MPHIKTSEMSDLVQPPGCLKLGGDTPEQAMRFNEGKPKLSFILDFPKSLEEIARVLEKGAEKYERNNWKQGLPITEVEDSLLRHLLPFHNGIDLDAESMRHHLGHVIVNAMFMLEHLHMHGTKFDNRDK